MRWRYKRKAPVAGGFKFNWCGVKDSAYPLARIRTGFARLPACSPAR